MTYKTSNPALNTKAFEGLPVEIQGSSMTLEGVSLKSLGLIVLSVLSGYFGWNLGFSTNMVILWVAIFAALIVGFVIIYKKQTSPFLSPVYAIIEGFVLGYISHLYEASYGGIVLQAVLLTLCIFVAMLLLYLFRLIRATENFKLGVSAATGGIALYYLVHLVLNLFGLNMPLIDSNSIYGIIFTLIIIAVAAANLVLDFDFIEKGVENKAPKYMEWYASFGLFVTIVWLYLELLRLLSKREK